MINIDALILAGGLGRRMNGADKGLLTLEEQTFAERLVALLRPFTRDVIISCNRNMAVYQKLADHAITDTQEGFAGPLAGILSAAQFSDADYFLVAPCDSPTLQPGYGERMIAGIEEGTSRPADVIRVAFDGEREQFLHCLVPRKCALAIESCLARGDRSVKGWQRKHTLEIVDFSDSKESFFNVNTQTEFDALSHNKYSPLGPGLHC